MSAILTWKKVEPTTASLEYVLTVPSQDPREMYLTLLTFLTKKNIALCSAEDYAHPDQLTAQQVYCIAGDTAESHLVFQCLPVPDWPEPPTPNFTVAVANLQWVLVPAP